MFKYFTFLHILKDGRNKSNYYVHVHSYTCCNRQTRLLAYVQITGYYLFSDELSYIIFAVPPYQGHCCSQAFS